MPNHTANLLQIKGDKAKIAELIAFVGNGVTDEMPVEAEREDTPLDFNKIVPRPESLNITSGGMVEVGMVIVKHRAGNSQPLREYLLGNSRYQQYIRPTLDETVQAILDANPIVYFQGISSGGINLEEAQKAIDNETLYGCRDWYSWSCDNWGTKWNAYDCGVWKISRNGEEVSLYFETAWSPPIPVISALAQKYPDLQMKLSYSDEGGGFVGFTEFWGDSTSETALEWDSDEGKDLLRELDRLYDEDEEDECDDDEEEETPAEEVKDLSEEEVTKAIETAKNYPEID